MEYLPPYTLDSPEFQPVSLSIPTAELSAHIFRILAISVSCEPWNLAPFNTSRLEFRGKNPRGKLQADFEAHFSLAHFFKIVWLEDQPSGQLLALILFTNFPTRGDHIFASMPFLWVGNWPKSLRQRVKSCNSHSSSVAPLPLTPATKDTTNNTQHCFHCICPWQIGWKLLFVSLDDVTKLGIY